MPVSDGGQCTEELNLFLRSHKVLAVDRRWVEQGSNSFWSFCVDYLESSSASAKSKGRDGTYRNKVDYKEVLSPEEFSLFAKLRELRKQISQEEAVPVYTVFTNEQLAEIVRKRVDSKADLEKIAGVGDARIEKYGARVLEFMSQLASENGQASG